MGFASLDEFINATTNLGQSWREDWNKLSHPVTAAVAGEWSALFGLAGAPTNGILNAGTNNSFQSLCDQSAGAMLHGGNVSPKTKHGLITAAGSGAVTTAPSTLMLVDMLGYYRRNNLTVTGDLACINDTTFTHLTADSRLLHAAYDMSSFTRVQVSTTGTLPSGLVAATDYWTVRFSATQSDLYPTFADAIALTNKVTLSSTGSGTHTITAGLPRYEDGAGVQLFSVVTTVLGAGVPTLRATYTNSLGTAGRLTPGTLPISKASGAVGLIEYSGTGAGKYGPFMPRAAGDAGIRSLQQTNYSVTHTSGETAWCLCRPLTSLPIGAVGAITERDLLNQFPSLPRIRDGACLAWLLMNGAATPANSGFYGNVEFGWN